MPSSAMLDKWSDLITLDQITRIIYIKKSFMTNEQDDRLVIIC